MLYKVPRITAGTQIQLTSLLLLSLLLISIVIKSLTLKSLVQLGASFLGWFAHSQE